MFWPCYCKSGSFTIELTALSRATERCREMPGRSCARSAKVYEASTSAALFILHLRFSNAEWALDKRFLEGGINGRDDILEHPRVDCF